MDKCKCNTCSNYKSKKKTISLKKISYYLTTQCNHDSPCYFVDFRKKINLPYMCRDILCGEATSNIWLEALQSLTKEQKKELKKNFKDLKRVLISEGVYNNGR